MNTKISKTLAGIALAAASICSSAAFAETVIYINVGNMHSEGTSSENGGLSFNYSALPPGLYNSSCTLNLVPNAKNNNFTVSYQLLNDNNSITYSSMGEGASFYPSYSGPFQVIINNTGQNTGRNPVYFYAVNSSVYTSMKYTIDCQTYPVISSTAQIYNYDHTSVGINPRVFSDKITGSIQITNSQGSTAVFTTPDASNLYTLAAGPSQSKVTYTTNADSLITGSIGVSPNVWPLMPGTNGTILLNNNLPYFPYYDFEPIPGKKNRVFSNAAPNNFEYPTTLVFSAGSMVVCTVGVSTIDSCKQ